MLILNLLIITILINTESKYRTISNVNSFKIFNIRIRTNTHNKNGAHTLMYGLYILVKIADRIFSAPAKK